MNLRERVIELSARITTLRSEIVELEKKRAELAIIESELDSILDNSAPAARATHVSDNKTKNGNGGSITQRIVQMLSEFPGQEFTAAKIHERMSDTNLPSLRSALARLSDEEMIQRAGRGSYRAKQT